MKRTKAHIIQILVQLHTDTLYIRTACNKHPVNVKQTRNLSMLLQLMLLWLLLFCLFIFWFISCMNDTKYKKNTFSYFLYATYLKYVLFKITSIFLSVGKMVCRMNIKYLKLLLCVMPPHPHKKHLSDIQRKKEKLGWLYSFCFLFMNIAFVQLLGAFFG